MKRALIVLAAVVFPAAVEATEVIDDFESGTNPNQWGWTNGSGGNFIIEPDGGNPGAWLDSGVPYFSDHPNLTSLPPDGSALRDALASGTITAARFDVERLDTTDVTNCHPTATEESTFSLAFFDIHSDPGGAVIEAHYDDGPASPAGFWPWMSVTFTVDSSAPIAAGVDGEAMTIDAPLRFESVPGALTVLLPPSAVGVSPAALSAGLSREGIGELWAAARTGGGAPPAGQRRGPTE